MHAINISAKFSLRLEHSIVGCNYVWRQRHARILAQEARTKIAGIFAVPDYPFVEAARFLSDVRTHGGPSNSCISLTAYTLSSLQISRLRTVAARSR